MLNLASAEPGVPVPCSELARAGNMPERFLLQILRSLVTQGLLRSTRGVVGGYCLSRPPAEITLGDVVDAFDYPLAPSAAALDALEPGVRERALRTLESAARLARHELQKLTVADLLRAELKHGHHATRTPHK
jgi:Rrf2 family protein